MFTSPAELSHYLTRFENSQNHYFTTLPTFQERHAVPSQKSFLQLLDSIESRDKRSLHLLGCSAKYVLYIILYVNVLFLDMINILVLRI